MLDISSMITKINDRIPFEEKVRDHDSILHAFLTSHTFQNHSQKTIEFDQRYLKGWFTGFSAKDDHHPEGRQLFIWEAMHPSAGRQIISNYADGLAQTDLRHKTCRDYLRRLRLAFDYVVRHPYIPGATVHLASPVMIEAKYNEIANPVTKYDYPPPKEEERSGDSPLVDDRLVDFLSWLHSDFLPAARNQATAGRTYAQILTPALVGFRCCELEGLDALGPQRDIDYDSGFIRTRFGKASRGSGKRPRRIEMPPLLRCTLEYYEHSVRTKFPQADAEPALFLSSDGTRLSYQSGWKALGVVVSQARRDGLILPSDMSWHSLRRSFATQYLDEHPGEVWRLLDLMGHECLLSLIRYVRPSREKVEWALNNVFAYLTEGAI